MPLGIADLQDGDGSSRVGLRSEIWNERLEVATISSELLDWVF